MQFDPSMVQTRYQSPLGEMCLAASSAGLAGAWFIDQRYLPERLQGDEAWPRDDQNSVLQRAIAQLQDYFNGSRTVFDLPLDLRHGTPFQQAVWRALLTLEAGQTAGYGALGTRLGRPGAARAVGAAVGRNTISIIVPCHRVIGSAGSLTGYAGGLQRKAALLQREGTLSAAGPFQGAQALSKGSEPHAMGDPRLAPERETQGSTS